MNLRFAECGRGKGDDESGSKAGSSDGFRVCSAGCCSGSKGNCDALAFGEESMVRDEGGDAKLGDVSCFYLGRRVSVCRRIRTAGRRYGCLV